MQKKKEKQACVLSYKCGGNASLIGLVIILAIIVGGYWFIAGKGAPAGQSALEAGMIAQKKANETAALVMDETKEHAKGGRTKEQQAGSYVPYDVAKFTMATDGEVVLFFRASWCPTCRALDADIKANAARIPANVTILDTDYDQYTDLKKKYAVTTQHTLVQVDAQGNEITKWVGSSGLSDIVSRLK